jgi:thiamine biosynthesis protein ThiI
MKEVILLKYGEIILKGLNRPVFEDILTKNIKRSLYKLGHFSLTRAQSTICVDGDETFDIDQAVIRLQKVFGIISVARAYVVKKDMASIRLAAVEYLKETLGQIKTFKVDARRSDKRFEMTSPQITADIGGYLLEAFSHLKVDLHSPEVVVMVEIRDFAAYIHAGSLRGAGGMPAGSNGRAALLISGGLDSPVAGYMLAKRGVELFAVHFFSPPYTSERAKLKVLDLLQVVSVYSGKISCFIVPFTKIQEAIKTNCPEDLFTIIMRRFMMKIVSVIAERESCSALITGESLGQVASQTMDGIACTDAVCEMPVFRPLIGMDKEEIVQISRKIGTYDISIQPFEDCCTVFTPRHPRTKPKLNFVELAESNFDFTKLLEEAVEGTEQISIG